MKKIPYLLLLLCFMSISLYAQPPQIAINQVGFYPKAPKRAIVAEAKGDTVFTDDVCSYASNEIAINWNAPAVYLLNAIEALE